MDAANIRRRKQNRQEYLKYQASPERKRYRSQLNRWARKRGIYGKRWDKGLDVVHAGGKIKGLGSARKNRAAGARAAANKRKK